MTPSSPPYSRPRVRQQFRVNSVCYRTTTAGQPPPSLQCADGTLPSCLAGSCRRGGRGGADFPDGFARDGPGRAGRCRQSRRGVPVQRCAVSGPHRARRDARRDRGAADIARRAARRSGGAAWQPGVGPGAGAGRPAAVRPDARPGTGRGVTGPGRGAGADPRRVRLALPGHAVGHHPVQHGGEHGRRQLAREPEPGRDDRHRVDDLDAAPEPHRRGRRRHSGRRLECDRPADPRLLRRHARLRRPAR